MAFPNIACPGMKTASFSLRRTAASVSTYETVCKLLLPLAVVWRSSDLTIDLNLKNLLNPKNLKNRAALWELFYGGRKESGMRRRVEASEPSKSLILPRKHRLPRKEAALIGVMECWSIGVLQNITLQTPNLRVSGLEVSGK